MKQYNYAPRRKHITGRQVNIMLAVALVLMSFYSGYAIEANKQTIQMARQ